MELEVEVNFRE